MRGKLNKYMKFDLRKEEKKKLGKGMGKYIEEIAKDTGIVLKHSRKLHKIQTSIVSEKITRC